MTERNPDHVRETEETRTSYDSETVEVTEDRAVQRRETSNRFQWLVYFLGTAVVILLSMRILLMLLAANPGSPFAALIYSLSDIFLLPFRALTPTLTLGSIQFETATIIAILVYAIITWGLAYLIGILFYRERSSSVRRYRRENLDR